LWALYDAGTQDETTRRVLRQFGDENVRKEYAYLDEVLADRAWLLGGDKPTVADAYLFAIGRWAEYHQLFKLEDSYPNVARYMRKLAQDTAVRFALDLEKDPDTRGSGALLGHESLETALA
jgi:glutathione S-transferase